jgi:hypothetical protein
MARPDVIKAARGCFLLFGNAQVIEVVGSLSLAQDAKSHGGAVRGTDGGFIKAVIDLHLLPV